MQNEDTLAALTKSPSDATSASMSSLLQAYGEQENLRSERRRTTFVPAQRTAILYDLSDILHLRGRLQQMGASFSGSGELLTYGNPPSPTVFEAMLKLGPMYKEQWNTFFVEGYVPKRGNSDEDGTGHMWSDLRTLKKMLENEGVVFGREHQRYSFGDSSTKLRRLCCAYDELRMDWLEMMRTGLPAHDDANLATIVDDAVEGDSGFVEESPPREHDFGPGRLCIKSHPPVLQVRSSGVVRNIGWRFSDDLTPPPRSNVWRFSDNLESVPVWNDVQDVTADTTPPTIPEIEDDVSEDAITVIHTAVREEADSPPPVPMKDIRNSIYPASDGIFGSEIFTTTPATPALTRPAHRFSLLHGPSPLQKMNTPSMILTEALTMDPRGDNLHIDPRMATTYIENAVTVNMQEPKPEKTGQKIRRWFKHTFGRK